MTHNTITIDGSHCSAFAFGVAFMCLVFTWLYVTSAKCPRCRSAHTSWHLTGVTGAPKMVLCCLRCGTATESPVGRA